jgi:hypothetical protein
MAVILNIKPLKFREAFNTPRVHVELQDCGMFLLKNFVLTNAVVYYVIKM